MPKTVNNIMISNTTSSEADNEESLCSPLCPNRNPINQTTSMDEDGDDVSSISSLHHELSRSEINNTSVLVDIGSSRSDFCNKESFNSISSCHYYKHQIKSYRNPKCKNPSCNNKTVSQKETRSHQFKNDSINEKTLSDECRNIYCWIRNKASMGKSTKCNKDIPCELYRMKCPNQEHNLPKRFIFDHIDGIPKPEVTSTGTNTKTKKARELSEVKAISYQQQKDEKDVINNKNSFNQKTTYSCSNSTRVDFYYFDHGNAGYFHTTDCPPTLMTDIIVERTENYTTKFWAEIFGSIHIVLAFFTSFILQFFKFILYGILRPLFIGVIQLSSDYVIKPFLTTLFNGIIQPPLIFLYNIATSLKDLCDPIAEGIGYFIREIAVLFRAVRLISVRKGGKSQFCQCDDSDETNNCDCEKQCCNKKKDLITDK